MLIFLDVIFPSVFEKIEIIYMTHAAPEPTSKFIVRSFFSHNSLLLFFTDGFSNELLSILKPSILIMKILLLNN